LPLLSGAAVVLLLNAAGVMAWPSAVVIVGLVVAGIAVADVVAAASVVANAVGSVAADLGMSAIGIDERCASRPSTVDRAAAVDSGVASPAAPERNPARTDDVPAASRTAAVAAPDGRMSRAVGGDRWPTRFAARVAVDVKR
jgi:hypothetical protein